MVSISIVKGRKKIRVNALKLGFLGKASGLMFKSSNTKSLLFDFSRDVRIAITSWFVFFPFLIIWLDEKNNVLEWQIVKPWVFSLKPRKPFKRFVEVPINAKNCKITEFFVGKRKRFKY